MVHIILILARRMCQRARILSESLLQGSLHQADRNVPPCAAD